MKTKPGTCISTKVCNHPPTFTVYIEAAAKEERARKAASVQAELEAEREGGSRAEPSRLLSRAAVTQKRKEAKKRVELNKLWARVQAARERRRNINGGRLAAAGGRLKGEVTKVYSHEGASFFALAGDAAVGRCKLSSVVHSLKAPRFKPFILPMK
jgi:hypothetical protein